MRRSGTATGARRWMPAAIILVIATLSIASTVTGRAGVGATHPESASRPASAAQPTSAVQPASWCDFDKDGFRDLVIAAPNATVTTNSTSHPGAGAVYVLYGTANGPTVARVQKWTQDTFQSATAAIRDSAEDNDHFGAAVACGDFNLDGFGDLAIGVPGEDRPYTVPGPQHTDAGLVEVIFGKPAVGLDAHGNIAIIPTKNQNGNIDPSSAWDGALFGSSLVALDMFTTLGGHDADGRADLAIGAPGFHNGDGLLVALSGDAIAARPTFNLFLQAGGGGGNIHFAASLARGDFDADGIDDLAAGTPFYDLGSIQNTGIIDIYYGDDPEIHVDARFEGVEGNPETPQSHDLFGASLAAGDISGDGIDDLVVGAPGRSVGSPFAGAVHIYKGSASFHVVFDRTITEDTIGIASDPAVLEFFGRTLAIANFGRGASKDLAIGAPSEKVAGVAGGAVYVLYGNSHTVDPVGSQRWTQNINGIPDDTEKSDSFGGALMVGQFGHGGQADLVIGVPGEDLVLNGTPIADTGLVHLLFGTANGLSINNNKAFSLKQITLGTQPEAAGGEKFGAAVQ